jgi:hypothetical protein
MEEAQGMTNEKALALLSSIRKIFLRNKLLLDTWEGLFSEEFVENLLTLKDMRNELGAIVGESQAFEQVKALYIDIFQSKH